MDLHVIKRPPLPANMYKGPAQPQQLNETYLCACMSFVERLPSEASHYESLYSIEDEKS